MIDILTKSDKIIIDSEKLKIKKTSKSLGNLLIKPIDRDQSKEMITKNHYSKKWNNSFGAINYGIFRDGIILGVAVYGNMMNCNAHSHIITTGQDSIIELNRLWISDELGKNAESILISASFKLMRIQHPKIKFIQSFADGRLGCGTIYKATNFQYYGYTKSLFFKNVESGEVTHKVPMENTARPTTFLSKNAQFLDGKMINFYVKTYRYIYTLDRDGLKKKNGIIVNDPRVLLKSEPYPEYDKGTIPVAKYVPSYPMMVRLYIMYDAINIDEYRDKVLDYLTKLGYTPSEIGKEINTQWDNEYVQEFMKNPKENRLKFIKNSANIKPKKTLF